MEFHSVSKKLSFEKFMDLNLLELNFEYIFMEHDPLIIWLHVENAEKLSTDEWRILTAEAKRQSI